ncbi:LRR receptor-like serine/threonine-protein kinase [Tripterygium wilfordii]|uniref:non-specific serine/threonine protein kinase n=2 Tax=Tripterygium wilfordii TaxID=458696 RepID=A0A7J7CAI8_TRIWF|nr:LRR receptor-like serine/threonine-protein kinase [Tripterygium wilfordii]
MGFVLSVSMAFSAFVFGFVALNGLVEFRSNAQLLPVEEVETLKTISAKLHNEHWNITRFSCGTVQWNTTLVFPNKIQSNVSCNCSFNNGSVCHITNILLKGYNVTGVLAEEFGNLTYLQELDLSRNYINGTIPASFARLPLTKLALIANRLSGTIPPEIGNIATLQELILEDNLLGGNLPENLGSLGNLKRLLLSANNFIGVIPQTYGKLRNLTDFRIDGSSLSGRIPDFIGNWTKLDRLDLQGTGLVGPIPQTISLLKNLTELRITDLNGSSSTFPNLLDMKNMERLILRNCLISDTIREYIGGMTELKELDLSFNRLTGEIPTTFQTLEKLDYMFLTNNSLTGEVPGWVLTSKKYLDLSYNNFTGSPKTGCEMPEVNLVSSHSSSQSNSVNWCLTKELLCSSKTQYHSLFINCGGGRLSFEGDDYEEDLNTRGPSTFNSVGQKWAYSSTGTYLNNDDAGFLATNSFSLNMSGAEFYKTARLAPLSLRYYGLCLRTGSYKVRLHFAEIMYSDDQKFSSLGRRIFDVSIQGQVVLGDFNIMEKARGVGKGIVMEFNNIHVNGSSLEIHLYWSGKGTTAVPDRGVYGPLISAISVTPNFKVDTGRLSTGAIVGIVIASFVSVILILFVLRMKGYLGGKYDEDKELRALDLQTGHFTLRQLKAATNNFDAANKIGEGGFGPVYKGKLSDGAVIAVKQLSSKSKQGNREFVNEIGMISALQHPNLVRLYGCCIEGNQLLLVYEYLENNSLARALFGPEDQRLNLNWETRKKICMDIARGLAYLHEESRLKIVHRDIKATNVLLDKDLTAKISDFGLAKLDEEENTHISTRIAGTIGYMAPEYAMRGYLTDKADVYSFGVVLLEIVSGKSNTNYRPKEEFVYLLDWAYVQQEQGNLLELVDPSLGSNYSPEEAVMMLNLALLCTNPSPTLRAPMSMVLSMLQGKIAVQAPLVKRGSNPDARFKAFEILSHDSQTNISAFSHNSQDQGSISIDGPWIDSSVSANSKDANESSSQPLAKDLADVKLD